MKVDVVMLTRNSAKPWFRNCLLSIRRERLFDKLIVVDRYSSDGTIELIREFFPDAEIIQGHWGLARARRKGIEAVETEYCAFVDSDIALAPDWGNIMLDILDSHSAIGGIHGKDLSTNTHLNKYWQWERWYYRLKERRPLPDVTVVDLSSLPRLKIRGLTHNTIVLHEAVKDWFPSNILTIGEDHHLMLHVLKKGLLWCTVNKPVAIHYAFRDLREVSHRGIIEGSYSRFLNEYKIIDTDLIWAPTRLRQWIRLFVLISLKASVASLMMKDPLILLHNIGFYGGCIKGHLKCSSLIPHVHTTH